MFHLLFIYFGDGEDWPPPPNGLLFEQNDLADEADPLSALVAASRQLLTEFLECFVIAVVDIQLNAIGAAGLLQPDM